MSVLGDTLDITKLNNTILCYAETIYRFNGVWEGPDPLSPLISLVFIQITFSICVTQLFVFMLKPFKQPPFVAELLGGIVVGPSVLGRIIGYRRIMFPLYSFKLLEPTAHHILILYAFLMGLKMDLRSIFRTGPKSIKVAFSGTIIPFAIGSGLSFIFRPEGAAQAAYGFLFWGSALTITELSVLTRVLDQHQLLHTDLGKIAMGGALINDMFAWAFLAFAIAITNGSKDGVSIVGTFTFVLFCLKFLRPSLMWIIHKIPVGQGYSDYYLCSVLAGMLLCGSISCALGTHPMIGAFLFGLCLPSEELEAMLLSKLEDFVMGLFMPVFFVVCGLRTNIDDIGSPSDLPYVMLVLIVLCGLKVFSSLLVTFVCEFPMKDAVLVGLLGNTKGILALVIIEAGQVQGALSTRSYSVMVVAVLVMTMIVTPSAIWFRPMKNTMPYKRRTIQKAKTEEELRILACIYNTRNIQTTINLLRTSSASQKFPINVFALQLVELTGRAATMLVVHNARNAGPRNPSNIEAQTDQIINAFDNYELRSEGVRTQTLTARCAYTTMEDDVCNIAKDKRATFIILPFHKQQTVDGKVEDIHPSIRAVNEGIVENAPCSVGILFNRGNESHDHATNIAVLFFSGPDDRESLCYAWRMAEDTTIHLTVVRFIPSSDSEVHHTFDEADRYHVSLQVDMEREKLLDEELIDKFKHGIVDTNHISYCELVLHDEEEAVKVIKSMDEHKHDLYMVGRGQGMVSPLTAGLADWCDCPELGPIGDLLVTSEFESSFSVLIVQQYVKKSKSRETSMKSSSSISYAGEENVVRRESVSDSEGSESPSREHDH